MNMTWERLMANRETLFAQWMTRVDAARADGIGVDDMNAVGPIVSKDGSLYLRVRRYGAYAYDLVINAEGKMYEEYASGMKFEV